MFWDFNKGEAKLCKLKLRPKEYFNFLRYGISTALAFVCFWHSVIVQYPYLLFKINTKLVNYCDFGKKLCDSSPLPPADMNKAPCIRSGLILTFIIYPIKQNNFLIYSLCSSLLLFYVRNNELFPIPSWSLGDWGGQGGLGAKAKLSARSPKPANLLSSSTKFPPCFLSLRTVLGINIGG